MKIAVLSGKGGAGKTFTAVNLAAVSKKCTYVDCDVEEPDGRLFLRPQGIKRRDVYVKIPAFDGSRCIGCRKCVDLCRFNALVFIDGLPRVFPLICHSCGGCALACPSGAVTEDKRIVGAIEYGTRGQIHVVTGVMGEGEASGMPVIREAIREGTSHGGTVIFDCPPGSACAVLECVSRADYCILAAEPTTFGFHNFRMVYRLVTLLKKPFGVVINKTYEPYEPLEAFCRERDIPVLLRIPYSDRTAKLCARAEIAAEKDEGTKELFCLLLERIGGAAL